MKKRVILFSSSEYSDSQKLKTIPQVRDPNKKVYLQSDYSDSYYYDYSSPQEEKIAIKKTEKPIARPPIKRNVSLQQRNLHQRPIVKQANNNHQINSNQNDNRGEKSSINNANKRPNRPPPRSINQNQHTQQTQKANIQKSSSAPSNQISTNDEYDYDYDYEYSNDQINDQKPQDSNEINTKIYCSPHEMKVVEVKTPEKKEKIVEDDDNAVIMSPQDDNYMPPPSANLSPLRALETSSISQQSFDSITYSVQRTSKIRVHGKSYIFSLIKEGNPVLYSKSNSRHPKGMMPISANKDIHIRNSGNTEYSITAENNCTKFVVKSLQQNILTFSISPGQNEYSKLPHLNVSIDNSFDFTPKEMTSKRPQMSKRGFWFLDFHNKFTLPSEKNAIFIPTNPALGGDDIIVVRKIAKDRIEIDVNHEAADIIVFGIGLSTFLAKLK